ncbi:hypothetical protein CcaCcLH18_08183 [Colletotrichum camelliae]|nr:hypothetical protein CcaCcLH18_08183 [Colletotrichum camelliae]
MASTADYHSVNNVEIERTPDRDNDAMTQQLHSDSEPDNTFDSDCGMDPEADGSDALSSGPERGKFANDFRFESGFINQESWIIKLISWSWEITLTVLPLFFICVSILSLKLDAHIVSTSTYGGKLEEIIRLGPTIYPILFAMVAGRFFKNMARWRLERPHGITISSLEQIIGSQSFASALERFITIRAHLFIGALILSSWAMSPLGGQSSARLLRVDEMTSEYDEWVYYDDRAYQKSVYSDMDYFTFEAADVITALYSASLLSPRQQQKSSRDLWARPKIPQWPWDSTQDGEEAQRKVDKGALEAESEHYTSLIGVNIQGSRLSDNLTQYEFDLDSDYINFNCSLIAETKTKQDLERISFPQAGNSTDSNLWEAFGAEMEHSTFAPSFKPILAYPGNFTTRPYLLYSSRGHPTNRQIYSVFNCTTATISLRTNLICTAQGCSPQRQRRLRTVPSTDAAYLQIRQRSLQGAFREWPKMTQVTGKASATDYYIANDLNTYGRQITQNWTGIDTKMFSRRLTTAFNTVWEAGMDSYNITKSSLALPEDPSTFWTNRTQATITTTEPAYYVNRLWAVILILTTTFLQVLAICGLVLKCYIRGPDILGFASSLTRDNAFVPICGGSFQGGAERARSLRNMRVQLADVQPRDSRGYIALSAVPSAAPAAEGNDGDKEESPSLGQLEQKRMYI